MAHKGFMSVIKYDFCDDEKDFPPSIVDSSGYEPIEKLILRIVKGEQVFSFPAVHEVGPDVDPRDAIRNLDATRREGFDLADVPLVMESARRTLEQEKASKEKAEQDKQEAIKKQELKDKEDLTRLKDLEAQGRLRPGATASGGSGQE